jgi:hypothetical protein
MDILIFIPGVGQLLSILESGIDIFLQGMSKLWNVNKMNNAIRLENANNEAYRNTKHRCDALMQKKKDAEDKAKKDLADKEKACWDRWKPHKKISYRGKVDGHCIDTIIWGRDQFMNPEEWEHTLRKYSSFVIQGKITKLNPNNINYFKG